MADDRSQTTTPTREQIDALFSSTDPRLIHDLAQAIARGCISYDVLLPPGCLAAITKSVLFTLDERRRLADG